MSPRVKGVTHEKELSDYYKVYLSQSGLPSRRNNSEKSCWEYQQSSCLCVGWGIAGDEAKKSAEGQEEERRGEQAGE